MKIVPIEWSVVLVGRWNKAILTPGRVATKIFGLPKGNLVEVKVPIDGISPYQIKHPEKNIFFVAGSARMQICLSTMTFADLEDAKIAGINALKWLPETPVSAVGFNISYRFTDVTPELLEKVLDAKINSILAGLTIKKHILGKTIEYKEGCLNITFTYQEEALELSLNFHKDSDQIPPFINWLGLSIEDIKVEVRGIFDRFQIPNPIHEENEDGK